jgi:hypothetical protein
MPQLKPDCAGDGDDEVQQGDDGRGVGPEAARAAVHLIRAKGYSDICASAGLTKGAFFRHSPAREPSQSP